MVPHNLPTLGLAEKDAVLRVLGSGWVAQGPEVEAFENELCDFFGLPNGHAVAVSSGSAALYLALWVLDGKYKKIGLPAYACAALRNAVGMVGGQCVYLDCKKGTPNVDVEAAARAEVDILIAPSMYGIPVDLPENRNFKLVEDLAQAIGATVNGQRIGLRGEVGICSFYATKLMTTGGQGGAVISRDKALIDQVRDYREFDSRDDTKLRFNFQMTDMQAAIGRVQLDRLPEFLMQREKWFLMYLDAGLSLLDSSQLDNVKPVRFRIVMQCKEPPKVIDLLASAGIRAIVPIEERELLDESRLYPCALDLTSTTVSLPAYPSLHANDVVEIARYVKEISCC